MPNDGSAFACQLGSRLIVDIGRGRRRVLRSEPTRTERLSGGIRHARPDIMPPTIRYRRVCGCSRCPEPCERSSSLTALAPPAVAATATLAADARVEWPEVPPHRCRPIVGPPASLRPGRCLQGVYGRHDRARRLQCLGGLRPRRFHAPMNGLVASSSELTSHLATAHAAIAAQGHR